MKLHAFVAMPFGQKPDPDGTVIDFNAVYKDLIKPALQAAGLEVFRADEELTAGDIKADMFQELLIADLVVADLTLDNPNVWYELGIRHALRARGVVIIQGPRRTQAFDVYSDRKLNYSLKNGLPDPATLVQDQAKLTDMVKVTLESRHERKISPVYQLLPNLQEPQWQNLRVGEAKQFWQTHDAWLRQIELTRKSGDIGGVLVLADEAPVVAFRAKAYLKAGIALRKAECFGFALEQLEKALAVEPEHLQGLQEKGICLQRLALLSSPGHSLDKAHDHYRQILETHANDAETWALLARIDKDAWVECWQHLTGLDARRAEAAEQDALLSQAITNYHQGYKRNPGHYYSGINALTLSYLYQNLTGNNPNPVPSATMAGAVQFAAECAADPQQWFWSKATLGDLQVLIGTADTVSRAYKDAIVHAEQDWFALNSSLTQLRLLDSLGFKPDTVKAGIDIFERALARLQKPESKWQPRKVLLFSGHMIDAPDRKEPRFPAAKESIAAEKIAQALDKLGANSDDLALTQGANGGDILFAEACLQRGVKLKLLQPFEEPAFIQKSVLPGGDSWRERYFQIKPQASIKAAPIELGQPPKDVDPYERCNLWLLYSALAYGIDKVQFICLWNGEGGDAPGGTAHMYHEVEDKTGQVSWLDTRKLWLNCLID
ncbi:MAG: tetratricopeptide repeat-containing protein [Methylococcales bacterium]